jgi:hypothetical protein
MATSETNQRMELDETQRRNFLKDEYLLLQTQYESFDSRSLTIKGWTSTGALAALAVGFAVQHEHSYILPLFVIVLH